MYTVDHYRNDDSLVIDVLIYCVPLKTVFELKKLCLEFLKYIIYIIPLNFRHQL